MANTESRPVEAESADFIEYAGEEPHGTAFLTTHTIPKGDPLWKRNKVSPSKDLVWERDPMGAAIGQKGNRMLLSTDGIAPEVLAVLEKTPGYKRVSE
jgi:hypothetical protein